MRVLLTGVAGFIGSHTARWILEHTDWELVGIESWRPHHKNSPTRIQCAMDGLTDEQRSRFTIHRWDLTHDLTTPAYRQIFEKPVDIIINMASDSHVTRSVTHPGDTWYNNCQLAYNVLQAARRHSDHLKVFIQISTDEVYGDAGQDGPGHHEWDTIVPSNVYSASKAAQEALAISYWRTYEVPVVITNCYDMATRVMSQDGPKCYADLNEGDLVWAMNKDEEMVLEPVLSTVKMPNRGRMVSFKTNVVDQLVTRNHRMMVRRKKPKDVKWGSVEEVTADDLYEEVGFPFIIPRHGKWTADSVQDVRPSDYLDQDGTKPACDLPASVTGKDFARLFGLYFSLGRVSGPDSVCFSEGTDYQQSLLEEVAAAFNVELDDHDTDTIITNGDLAELLAIAGKSDAYKVIPDFIREQGCDFLAYFFEAVVGVADSHVQDEVSKIVPNHAAAYHFAEIAMKLEYGAVVSVKDDDYYHVDRWPYGEPTKERLVTCDRHPGQISPQDMYKRVYDDDVWCLSVASGRVFVERNGNISLSGQTMNVIGEWQDPEKFLPLVINRVSNGEVVKLCAESDGVTMARRCWMDVKNMAAALVHICEHVEPRMYVESRDRPKRFHIVGKDDLDVRELATLVAKTLGKELISEVIRGDSVRPGYDRRYALADNNLKATGFEHPFTFEETIKRVLDWAQEHPNWVYE